jgi:uncharacterized protein (TIGR04255 family)
VNGPALPYFSDPPLQEVAISAQFEPLQRLVVPEIGRLWQHYGSKYHHVEQHPPLPSKIERIGVRPPLIRKPTLRLVDGPVLPRVWFLSEDKRELIQIQQDRFIRNWRKLGKDDDYPRYDDHIRPEFLSDLQDFANFVSENSIGDIVPNQCEVTYSNLIVSGECWETHADIGEVFTAWSREYARTSRYELEDARFSIRHLIKAPDGDFLGRLYITTEPTFIDIEGTPGFRLDLVARGRPLSSDLEGIMGFLDLGREHIVRAFADVTRPDLHRVWGRQANLNS